MSCLLERQDACLPITALTDIEIEGNHFVLAGVGPCILLIDESCGSLLDSIPVFERNAVHGLHVIFSGVLDAGKHYAKILLWGGQSIRIVKLTFEKSRPKSCSLSVISSERLCPDWILDIDAFEQSCGDAFSPSRSHICIATAHNTLLCAQLTDDASHAVSIDLRGIASSLKPILYSADINWITSSRVLVAAGTVFGEIIVWSCEFHPDTEDLPFSESFTCIHHFFTGHEGSIFDINISSEIIVPEESGSQRFLASCSDDRTIRVWDISSCSSGEPERTCLPLDRNIRGTGFKVYNDESHLDQDSCVAKVWAHEARIWGARFLGAAFSGRRLSLKIISYSEDATCQLWNFGLPSDTPQDDGGGQGTVAGHLSHLKTYRYHTGKHVWSLATRENRDSFTIYSGGADGNLISFDVGRHSNDPSWEQKIASAADDIIDSLPRTGHQHLPDTLPSTTAKKKKNQKRVSGYSFVADNCFLAASSDGRVLLGYVKPGSFSQADVADQHRVSWQTVAELEGITAYSAIAADPRQQLGIIGSKAGDIWLYNHKNNSVQTLGRVGGKIVGLFVVDVAHHQRASSGSRLFSFVASFIGASKVELLCVRIDEFPSVLSRCDCVLPEGFLVMAAAIIEGTAQMILSSREGAIVIYDDLENLSGHNPVEPSRHIRGVHGEDAITSISNLKQSDTPHPVANYVLTAGRDGYYCVHELISDSPGLRTIHRSSPHIRLNLEKATVETSTNDLILMGFRGTSFVLWNESRQCELMAVECGGVHRTWVYHSSELGRLLIWNKSSIFHAFPWTKPSHHALRIGGHGREVKTIAISPQPVQFGDRNRTILATGAEDTLIRLFMLNEEGRTRPQGSFTCLRTLKHHEAGIQHLQWSSNSRRLFSSSGSEEFQVWRITYIPGFGIGVVAEGDYPKGQPKSDLRITHFHAVEVEVEDEGLDAFLICMCYSNSLIKAFYYVSDSRGWPSYTLLAQGRYTSNCLTHIQLVFTQGTPCLITTATDGCIAIWDAAPVLGSAFSISNGAVQLTCSAALPSSPTSLTWQDQHSVHQSSIKSMTSLALSETVHLIMTGGDDNSLAFSILSRAQSSTDREISTTAFLRDAHASAINDVTILRTGLRRQETDDTHRLEFQLASSGNDQRLKVWMVQVPLWREGGTSGETRVSLRADVYTAVADLSCLGTFTREDTVRSDRDAEGMVLCGVGMEMWSVGECLYPLGSKNKGLEFR